MELNSQVSCINCNKLRLVGFFGAFLAIIAIFFIVPIFEKNFFTHIILQCSFVLLILSTVYAIEGQRSILITGILFLTPFIYFDSLSFLYHSLPSLIIAYGFSSVFTLFAIFVLMRKILYSSIVNADLIFQALMVYLLSGILWANLYFIENIVSQGSFQGVGILNFDITDFLNTYEQQFNFLYYSFATLATLGMGDITPLDHLAKSLTAMEAMFGQLFVAVVIAKLVSVWRYVPDKRDELL
ncbi:MAG TPA: ion channel [Parachlamydiaceae bacterium]|nr:ion channel [Parachlamydiaceae bacterium]